MRLMLGMTMGLAALTGLSACGQSDDAFRADYRTKAVAECGRGAGMAAGASGVDTNRLCSCIVDNYMRATSTAQLKAEQNQSTPPAAAQAAMMQCAREQGAMGGAPSATPPAANEAAPAPTEAPAGEGEAEGNEAGGE